jgi:hypothetical protein
MPIGLRLLIRRLPTHASLARHPSVEVSFKRHCVFFYAVPAVSFAAEVEDLARPTRDRHLRIIPLERLHT